jgi:L-aminopeptidase/D-esterase-like protein
MPSRNDNMDDVFAATAQATEEAIINALVAADPLTGAKSCPAIDTDKLKAILKKFNRLNSS